MILILLKRKSIFSDPHQLYVLYTRRVLHIHEVTCSVHMYHTRIYLYYNRTIVHRTMYNRTTRRRRLLLLMIP